MIRILPLARDGAPDAAKKQLLELQLKMATSSINHEYARMEYDDADDRERRDDLLEYMHDCRRQYFEARGETLKGMKERSSSVLSRLTTL